MEQNNTTEKPWYKKTWVIVVGVILLLGIIGNLGKKKDGSGNSSSTTESASNTNTTTESKPSYPTVGQTLKTDYFEVTINKAMLNDRVSTGNQFADLKPEQGNMYLLLNTTFKNIDNESRMLTDGAVYITYNGKEYQFDHSEMVMLKGYGLFLDQINPLTSKTTTLVYKIPAEIKGPAYYKPGRAEGDQKIFIGTL